MSQVYFTKNMFDASSFHLLQNGELSVELFRYSTDIEAIRIRNKRGYITILPYMGQMIWDAVFDNINLKMQSMFNEPQQAQDILGTYGCFMYHAGILRNGNPTETDDHNLHGEFPCAPMQKAYLEQGEKQGQKYIRIISEYEYIKGFGDHYLATACVSLFEGSSLFDVDMRIQNLSSKSMDVMYMAHLNNAFEPRAILYQMAEYNKKNMQLRTSIPSHVKPTEDWLNFMKQAQETPEITQQLKAAENFDPEVVYFIKNLQTDEKGYTHLLMENPKGGGHYCRYKPKQLPHLTRWILYNEEQKVAAFALPGTCDPEGYTTEKEKGNIIALEGGSTIEFNIRTGYVKADKAEQIKKLIKEKKNG